MTFSCPVYEERTSARGRIEKRSFFNAVANQTWTAWSPGGRRERWRGRRVGSSEGNTQPFATGRGPFVGSGKGSLIRHRKDRP